jgi:hypothetical protein
MGRIGCPETSVTNYRSTLRNIPEKLRSELYWCVYYDCHNKQPLFPYAVLTGCVLREVRTKSLYVMKFSLSF